MKTSSIKIGANAKRLLAFLANYYTDSVDWLGRQEHAYTLQTCGEEFAEIKSLDSKAATKYESHLISALGQNFAPCGSQRRRLGCLQFPLARWHG